MTVTQIKMKVSQACVTHWVEGKELMNLKKKKIWILLKNVYNCLLLTAYIFTILFFSFLFRKTNRKQKRRQKSPNLVQFSTSFLTLAAYILLYSFSSTRPRRGQQHTHKAPQLNPVFYVFHHPLHIFLLYNRHAHTHTCTYTNTHTYTGSHTSTLTLAVTHTHSLNLIQSSMSSLTLSSFNPYSCYNHTGNSHL